MPIDLSRLNDSQIKAVTHKNGPLMIVAGAGTGKTAVITHRIAWIVSEGLAKPREIVALTFTEKAAAEMAGRLETLIGHEALAISATTFHGFCQNILGRFGLEIGVAPNAPILNEIQLWLLLHRHFGRLKLNYFKPRGNSSKFLHSLIRHFLRAKDENISVESYRAYVQDLKLKNDSAELMNLAEDVARFDEIAEAYCAYTNLLLERGVMDFGDLLLWANRLISERPRVARRLRDEIKYIVVDEFQDTNMAQYDLVRALLGPEQNITVVGDDDQAIYKFRGASVGNILKFREHFPDRVEVFLTSNYRSRQEILDAAYRLIQFNNPHRLECDESGISTGKKRLVSAFIS